jgi:hypothetical protein
MAKEVFYMIFRIIIIVALNMIILAAHATTFFVATTGNDANKGSLNDPFRTIQKAADNMKPGDTCRIFAGIYPEQIKVLTSGKQGLPLVFMLVNKDDEVVVTGLDPIPLEQWQRVENNIYKVNIKLSLDHENQVFFGNRMGIEARWPNTGDDLLKPTLAEMKSGTLSNKIGDEKLPDYDFTGAQIWIHAPKYWSNWTTEITGSPATGELYIKNIAPYPGPRRHVAAPGAEYFLFGFKDALDDYFEWFYDKKEQFLYIHANQEWLTENPVSIKRRMYGFDLTDRTHITIDGIKIFAASVLTSENSAWLNLNKVTVFYPYHSTQATNRVNWQKDKGLVIKGTNCTIQNSEIAYSSGSGVILMGKYNKVINCYIHDTDYIGTYASCVQLSGKGNTISHCTLTRTGRSVIDYAGMYQSLIQYCDMSYSGMLTSDLGLTYGNVIEGGNSEFRYNYLHDNQGAHLNMGLYYDHGTKNIISHHNIIWNVDHSGLLINHYGNYHLVYNNTFIAKNHGFRSVWGNQYEPDLFGSRIINNIFGGPYETNAKNFTFSNNLVHYYKDLKQYFVVPDSALNAGELIAGINDQVNDKLPDIGAIEQATGTWKVGHDFNQQPVVDTTRSNPDHRNLIKNAAFEHEDHLIPWKKQGSVKINLVPHKNQTTPDTATVRMGRCSIKLAPGGKISQTINNLLPQRNYTLSAMLRVDEGAKAAFEVIYPDGSSIISEPMKTTFSQWKRLTLDVLSSEVSSIEIFIITDEDGKGDVYVDDTGFSLQ